MKKKSAARTAAEQSGGIQGQPWPHIPLSVPERRRLGWHFLLAVQQTAYHIRAWSHGRRGHPSRAKYYPYTRRGALAELLAA